MFLATASLVIGAHVATMHPPESSGPEYNDFNPGVYVKFDTEAVSGITLGAYHNSFHRPTFYAAKTWEFERGRFGLTLGAATGYQYRRLDGDQYCPQGRVPPCWWSYGNTNAVLRPLAALSVAFPEAKPYLFGATPRLSLLGMKKTVPTTHLSFEWSVK